MSVCQTSRLDPASAREHNAVMSYASAAAGTRYAFPDLRPLLAKASPARSGDRLAGLAATSAAERVAALLR